MASRASTPLRPRLWGLAACAAAIGLLLAPATGLVVRMGLVEGGRSVVSLERGVSMALRVTLFAVLPCFLLFGWLATVALRDAWQHARRRFRVRRAAWRGALVGQTLAMTCMLLSLWPDSHFLGITMLLELPASLMIAGMTAAMGALVGGAAGAWIGRALSS